MNYPSPCEKCDKEYGCDGCEAWEIRYRYRQKQINAYAAQVAQPVIVKQPENKFCYEHPDIVRQYLKKHPCEDCVRQSWCNIPCQVYLHWYNARMEIVRKKVQG